MELRYRITGIYELITGSFGIILLVLSLFREMPVGGGDVLVSFLLGLILYGFLAFAGILLLKGKPGGKKYSLWLQALQVPAFTYEGISYLFSASAFFSVVFDTRLHIVFDPKIIDYMVTKVPASTPFEVRIYIMPLIFILMLITRKTVTPR